MLFHFMLVLNSNRLWPKIVNCIRYFCLCWYDKNYILQRPSSIMQGTEFNNLEAFSEPVDSGIQIFYL